MNLEIYLQIELFPLISLILILFLSTRQISSAKNIGRFRVLVFLIILILAVDTVTWHSMARSQFYSLRVMWILNILYFLLTEIISFFWFQYVYHQVTEEPLSRLQKRLLSLSIIPLLVICIIIVTSPWNHAIFFIDPSDKSYHRGSFHFLQTVFGFGYMLSASILAAIRSRKVLLMDRKKEARFLCFIALLPFIGGIMQLSNYYFIFLWPFTAAAAFLIYVDYQSHHVSVDSLTSLNNRRSLEMFLQKKERAHESEWFFVMLDIDRFKQINDKFGHIMGDRALKIVARSLKNIFGKTDSFICRFGGDEFVIVSHLPSKEELDSSIERFRQDVDRQTKEQALPFDLFLSVGYAFCDDVDKNSPSSLLHTADRKMYLEKALHKKDFD